MNGVNTPAPTIDRYAPPRPARALVVSAAQLRVATTLTPAASSASGFSPAALRLRPILVFLNTHASRPANANPMYTSAGWLNRLGPRTGILSNPGIATVAGAPRRGYVVPNWAPCNTLVMPSPARVMAIPTTI